MGQEINASHFSARDFGRFLCRLRDETEQLGEYFQQARLADTGGNAGFELEAWLIDAAGRPAPLNQRFLEQLDSRWVVPELASFNVELNTQPQKLQADALAVMQRSLQATWSACQQTAAALDARVVMIGILPSVTQDQLTLRNMSPKARYRALNEQVFMLRHGDPLHIHIEGRELLSLTHHDVMLEAGTTSLQIHLQVPPARAHVYLNTAQIISAPMVAAAANSPYLFGHDLWQETRVPLFEQAVEVGSPKQRRVTFGSEYWDDTLFNCFVDNRDRYPVLVPINLDDEPAPFAHLRFHNGTIWRWNRPLIGVETDPPHVRIEHRVVPAGPSVLDSIANAALFFGLCHYWANSERELTRRIPFPTARTNFYRCARHGLDAQVDWLDDWSGSVRDLLLEQLLPQARAGLDGFGLDAADIDRYMQVLEQRVASGRNGAAWQRAWVDRHGRDMAALTQAYYGHQESGRPVHEWPL